ncbi:hypothetical protein LguiB_014339 [Lonicera macranthoides]
MDSRLYSAATTGTNLDLLAQNRYKLGHEKTKGENTVLHVASQFGPVEAVKLIHSLNRKLLLNLNKTGDGGAKVERARKVANDIDGFTALQEAVRYHHVDFAKMLIE